MSNLYLRSDADKLQTSPNLQLRADVDKQSNSNTSPEYSGTTSIAILNVLNQEIRSSVVISDIFFYGAEGKIIISDGNGNVIAMAYLTSAMGNFSYPINKRFSVIKLTELQSGQSAVLYLKKG